MQADSQHMMVDNCAEAFVKSQKVSTACLLIQAHERETAKTSHSFSVHRGVKGRAGPRGSGGEMEVGGGKMRAVGAGRDGRR